MADYLSGICQTGDWLEEFNQGRMEQITLSEANQNFLEVARLAISTGSVGEREYVLIGQAASVQD